jgi:hypothetical protein
MSRILSSPILSGPGFSIPTGLLIAGISITAAFAGLLPKWIAGSGILLAVIGELSWLRLPFFPKFLFLIPLRALPCLLRDQKAGWPIPAPRRRISACF